MTQVDDVSRCLTALDEDSTLVAIVEMSQASWLTAGLVPGVDRRPLKKLEPDAPTLLRLLERWRAEATKAGRTITRIVLAYEAGRDGFWLARWLRARGIEAHVIHSTSVAVSREHRRAKTDRLDTTMLMRGSWAGCAASGTIAGWSRSRCSRRRMPSARAVSAKAWWASAPGLSTT
jgi:transposase